MTSIRLRLLKGLLVPVLLVNLAAAAMAYLLAWLPAQQAFDEGLLDTAAVLQRELAAQGGRPTGPAAHASPADSTAASQGAAAPTQAISAKRDGADRPPPAPRGAPAADPVLDRSGVDRLYVSARDGSGQQWLGAPHWAHPPASSGQLFDARMDGNGVRAVHLPLADGGTLLVAKTVRGRAEQRAAILRGLMLTEALVTLVMGGLIWFSVTAALQPLARLRQTLAGREPDELLPVEPQPLPDELEPLANAFNDLLDRVQAATRTKQAFLADVAHQLRTPLAGTKLQLEWLAERHREDPDTQRALDLLRATNERLIRQTNQLLALARAEPGQGDKRRRERTDLAELVAPAIQYFVDAAAHKEIDLGFELGAAPLQGDPFQLRDLIDNMVDNAIRYTPARGIVTVRSGVNGNGAWFEVEDTGPGIPPSDRKRVFERHVRLDEQQQGSGLGLAIVREIALAHGAQIELADGASGRGLRMRISFGAGGEPALLVPSDGRGAAV